MSGRIHIKDKFGNDLHFGNAGDIWCPQFPDIQDYRQHCKDVRTMELRPDDVILTGYAKCGTHWHKEIIHMLLEGVVDYVGGGGFGEFLDAFPRETWLPPTKPRVFFTHFRFHHLPIQAFEKKVKVIYITRNPKSSWVSYYNHMKGFKYLPGFPGTWEHYFEDMMDIGLWYGDWFDYVLDWERQLEANAELPVLTTSYEELKKDPVRQIERMDQFLGTNRDRKLIEGIAKACEFSTLKAVKDVKLAKDLKMLWEEGNPGFFRKGEIDDWKNYFTVAQNERFEAEYEKRMAGSKLKFIYE